MLVVVVGDPFSGMAIHGPFESEAAAAGWAERTDLSGHVLTVLPVQRRRMGCPGSHGSDHPEDEDCETDGCYFTGVMWEEHPERDLLMIGANAGHSGVHYVRRDCNVFNGCKPWPDAMFTEEAIAAARQPGTVGAVEVTVDPSVRVEMARSDEEWAAKLKLMLARYIATEGTKTRDGSVTLNFTPEEFGRAGVHFMNEPGFQIHSAQEPDRPPDAVVGGGRSNAEASRVGVETPPEGVDPLGTPEAWEAWHNPSCPDVEPTVIEGVSQCITFTPGAIQRAETGTLPIGVPPHDCPSCRAARALAKVREGLDELDAATDSIADEACEMEMQHAYLREQVKIAVGGRWWRRKRMLLEAMRVIDR